MQSRSASLAVCRVPARARNSRCSTSARHNRGSSLIGRLHRIDVKAAANVSLAEAREKITALLPPGVTLATPDEASQRVSNVSRAYRVNLNVLALVALFTGAFLVFSLQAQAVVARRTELAFLRISGLTAGQLQRWLVGEAAIVGVIGSALGIALGIALASSALAVLGGDLGSGFFAGAQARLTINPGWTFAFFVLGVAAAIAGGWGPAREAARVEPALALKAGSELDALKPLGGALWPACTVLALGAGAALLPPVRGLPVFGYVSIALLLVGAIMLQPRLAHAVFERIGLPAAARAACHGWARRRGWRRRRRAPRSGSPASSPALH